METEHPTPAAPRLLVVDDEPAVLAFIREALTDEGYTVQTAGNGEEALQLARSLRPDLILLDVRLPGLDGWDVLDELRAATGKQSPVVVMTAGFDGQDRALATGAQGYLGKPFDLDDLISAVEAHAGLPMRGPRETAVTVEQPSQPMA